MSDASDNKNPDLGIGPGTLARVIRSALDIMERKLRDHAATNDGSVPLNALRSIRQSVDPDDSDEMRKLVSSGWKDIANAAERENLESKRKYPLERLIVQRFDHLLAPHGKDPVQNQTLSRRVIPAFIAALQQMIGPELYQEYEDRCQAIVDATRDRVGESFSWSMVYADSGAHVLVTDILVYIARYFDDVERRRHWMEDFFERMMPPGKTEAEQQWKFKAMEFHMLIDALYQNLQRGLSDSNYATRLKKRYGDANLAYVEIMLENMAVDKRSVEATADNENETFL